MLPPIYPDPVLCQILTSSTFSGNIPTESTRFGPSNSCPLPFPMVETCKRSDGPKKSENSQSWTLMDSRYRSSHIFHDTPSATHSSPQRYATHLWSLRLPHHHSQPWHPYSRIFHHWQRVFLLPCWRIVNFLPLQPQSSLSRKCPPYITLRRPL